MLDGNGGKREHLRELAESQHGQNIYALHDAGFKLADTQREMTPIQKFVYITAKDFHTDDYDSSSSSAMGHGHNLPSGL